MLSLILLVFALVLFIIAGAFNYAGPSDWPWRNRLICFGLACWVASELVTHGPVLLGK
jgi:hypothetical protein